MMENGPLSIDLEDLQAVNNIVAFSRAIEIDEDWTEQAACRDFKDIEFVPGDGANWNMHIVRAAKRVCELCEVQIECLEAAMQRPDEHGIWGGVAQRERRKLRYERNARS